MASTPPASQIICLPAALARVRPAWIAVGLFLLTLALFAPALGHDFLTFDDQQYVTENPHLHSGLSWPAVAWAFTTFRSGNWHPVTWLSHLLDCQIYGLRPWGHHLTSILFHAANASLLFLVLQSLTAAPWRSAAVAALFAWHPAHVESVAWIAERKDVLSAFFFVLTLAAYIRHARGAARFYYPLALFFFALGLMAKPMLVSTPFVLLLLDFWPLQRRAWLEKIPFFLIAAGDGAVTLLAQSQARTLANVARLSLTARAENAAVSCFRYVGELFFPHNLAVYYPYQNIPGAEVIAATFALAATFWAVIHFRRGRPWLFFGWLWFFLMLLPVIGLFQVGAQSWADRYSYLPSIGFFLALVWSLKPAARYFGAVILLLLALLTLVQLSYWRDTRSLFEHTARVTSGNYLALGVLASVNDHDGKLADAERDCAAALRDNPDYAPALFILGHIRDQQGRFDDAIANYTAALSLAPDLVQAHLFLGVAQARKKQFADAETNYLAALALNPDSAPAHNDLGKLRQFQGRLVESQAEYSAALRLDPRLEQAHNNLGIFLLQQGNLAEGAIQLREALRLNPANAQTAFNLALALQQQNKPADALAAAQQALQIAQAQSQLDVARRAQQMLDSLRSR